MLTRRSTSKLTILNANLDPQANQHTVVYVERRTYMVWETTKKGGDEGEERQREKKGENFPSHSFTDVSSWMQGHKHFS